jgi:DNA repair exonuclease SbcCD ATPase subunit
LDTQRISFLKTKVVGMEQRLEDASSSLVRFRQRLSELENSKIALVKAIGLLDKCIEIVSSNGIQKIESIVSHGLQLVFEDSNLRLFIDKRETTRGNSYRLLIKNQNTTGNPMDSFGGAVQNVVAFLLRVILVKRFKLAKLLILDEQFSNVSEDLQPKISALLDTMTKKFGYTLLTVSHQPLITQEASLVYKLLPTATGPVLRELTHENR